MTEDDLHLMRHHIAPDMIVDLVDVLVMLDRGAEGQTLKMVVDGDAKNVAIITPKVAELLIDFLGLLATKHDATTFVLDRTSTLRPRQVSDLLGHKLLTIAEMSGSFENVSWDEYYRTTAASVIDLIKANAVADHRKAC